MKSNIILGFLMLMTFKSIAQITPCGVSNPATDLPWLTDLISLSCDPNNCIGQIFQGEYNGQTVFYNMPDNTQCSDVMTSVNNCEGNLICFFGGIAGGNGEGCPSFFETVSNVTLLSCNQTNEEHFYYTLTACADDTLSIGLDGMEGNTIYEWLPTDGIISCACDFGICNTCFNINVSPDNNIEYVLHTFTTITLSNNYYHYNIIINENCNECVDSSLIDPSVACIQIYDPVCGCNGKTYGNNCEALYYGGVTNYTPGECAGAQQVTICVGDSIQLNAPINNNSNQWLNTSNISCQDCPNPLVWPNENTQYILSQTSNGNPNQIYQYIVNVEQCSDKVDETEINKINIIPNPTTGDLTIDFDDLSVKKIEFLNAVGQILWVYNDISNSNYRMNIANFTKGIYFMRVFVDDKIIVKKVLKI